MSNRKLIRRFYEPVHLLHALDPTQGKHKKSIFGQESNPVETPVETLQKFLNAVAYVCDIAKGGKTVAAAALEEKPDEHILWIASNLRLAETTQSGLNEILDLLQSKIPNQDAILRKIVKLHTSRLNQYKKWADDMLVGLLNNASFMGNLGPGFKDVLLKLQDRLLTVDLVDVVTFCYNALRSTSTRSPDFQGLITQTDGKHIPEQLKRLKHAIGRLGTYQKILNHLIRGQAVFPELFVAPRISAVFRESPPEKPSTLATKTTTPDGIVGRMFSTAEGQKDFKEKLQKHDMIIKGNDSAGHGIADSLHDKHKTSTRVHAELQLLDYFYKTRAEFFKHVAYIGCSKPACYLCTRYVKEHPRQVELRGTHEKIYLNWRVPDEDQDRKIIEGMIQVVRSDVVKHLDERVEFQRRVSHPDTTTGLGTHSVFNQSEMWDSASTGFRSPSDDGYETASPQYHPPPEVPRYVRTPPAERAAPRNLRRPFTQRRVIDEDEDGGGVAL